MTLLLRLSLNSESASLAVNCCLLFFFEWGWVPGFFRIGEVLCIRVRDVSMFDFMKVYLIMRQNDQYRDGHVSVTDYWSRKPTYPAGITE